MTLRDLENEYTAMFRYIIGSPYFVFGALRVDDKDVSISTYIKITE